MNTPQNSSPTNGPGYRLDRTEIIESRRCWCGTIDCDRGVVITENELGVSGQVHGPQRVTTLYLRFDPQAPRNHQ